MTGTTMTGTGPAAGGGLPDALLRVAGGLVALAGGFLTGALVVLLVPLRVADLPVVGGLAAGAGVVRVPIAVAVAVCGALALIWFVNRATGVRWGGLLPVAGWLTIIVVAASGTDEGDMLLMPDDVVATPALFGGTLVLVVGMVIRLVLPASPAPAVPLTRVRRPG